MCQVGSIVGGCILSGFGDSQLVTLDVSACVVNVVTVFNCSLAEVLAV